MVLFRKFCCCCKLRTGTITLAWLGLIYELFDLIAPVTLYANREFFFPVFPHDSYYYNMGTRIAVSMSMPYYITFVVIKMLCFLSMIYGAMNGKRYYLLPWLIMDMIQLSLLALTTLIGGVIMMVFLGVVGFVVWIVGFAFCALQFYIWLCVFSCFQEMRDSGNSEDNGHLLGYPVFVQNFLAGYRPANTNTAEA